VLVSSDGGMSWTPASSGVGQNLDAIAWTGTRFLAVGEGVAIASIDGLSWQRVALSTRRSLRALVPWSERAVAVGDDDTHVRLAG
jgi:hypothetical protein